MALALPLAVTTEPEATTMKLKPVLAGTAIAALTLFTGAALPTGILDVPRAEAAVSISISLFYDELEAHGDWVRYRDAYVFIPANVSADWRPYTLGHWVYAKRYGWTWVSEEPFGWATYHYGRWGYADEIGWYWVPGTRWAPAWVSWRRSNDYIVWAPLPPSGGGIEVSVSVEVGDIPEFYWVAVPARQFLAPEIHVVVVREEREIREVIERTEYVGAPRITNNIVVNTVIDVDVVTQVTGQEVETVEVKATDDPKQATASGEAVTVFEGEVAVDEAAKPKEVREATEVKKVMRKDGASEGEAAGTEPAQKPDAATGTTAAPEAAPEEPAANTAEEPEALPETPQKPPKATAEDQPDTPQKPPKAKAEDQPEEPADEATGTTEAPKTKKDAEKAGEETQKQKGQDKGKKDCDPAEDPDCQPAQ